MDAFDRIAGWLGDLHQLTYLTPHQVGLITIAVASLCGAIVGLEREKREKPAGLRTLILICVGCAIFTMASLLAGNSVTDRARIASNVAPGIGFLGAGAIIHDRRGVVGLTTAATIWSVAGIGVTVGLGYAAAGVVLSFFIFVILTFLKILERWMFGPCRMVEAHIQYQPDHGKGRQRLLAVLDRNQIPQKSFHFSAPPRIPGEEPQETLTIHYCTAHRAHRAFLTDLAVLSDVKAIEEAGGGRG